MNPELEDEVIGKYIDLLEENVPHPAPSDLIFGAMKNTQLSKLWRLLLTIKKSNHTIARNLQ